MSGKSKSYDGSKNGYSKLKIGLKMNILDRFFRHSDQSYFLFGPGKSTWLHRHLPNSFVIDLLAPDSYRTYSANLRSKSVSSLAAFKEDYPEAEAYLLYRGKERIYHNQVLCLPCEEFLKKLVPGQPIKF
jgi:hypothetical protein